jgi:Tfp pilus assembly protein PilF
VFSAAGSPAAAAYNLGIVCMAQGRFRSAAAAFTRAASLQPGLSLAVARARQARRLADANPGTEDNDGRR